MGVIKVLGIKSHSFHGCMEEESKIGADYIVDVEVEANFKAAGEEDDLSKTVDYVDVNRVVEEEMDKRSKLIETVAQRIVKRLMNEITLVDFANVTIKKINPPINGNVDLVSVNVTSNDI